MDPKLWRILCNSYSEFKIAVRLEQDISSWFTPEQGVHQGDVFSMRLHSLYFNGLLADLRALCKGVRIDDILVSPQHLPTTWHCWLRLRGP